MDATEVKEVMDAISEKNGNAIRECVKNETRKIWETIEIQGSELRKHSGGVYEAGNALGRILADQQKAIAGLVSGERRSIKFTVPLTANKTLVTRSSVSGSTMSYRLPDVGQLAYPNPVISSLFRHSPVGPSSNGMIRYYDQLAITRAAAAVSEGSTKPESAATWIERSVRIEKVADSLPVTKESLSDVFFIESEIRRLLETNLGLKIDDLLYDGDGITPNLKGVYTSAPAFVSTPYADSIEAANLYDLIFVVAADIGANSQYRADTVLINPVDALRLKLYKTSQGAYLLPPFLENIRIVESSQVAVNTMVVGDFRFGTIYDLEDVTIEMGWINDQFIKNCVTILAEQRLALLIRVADEPAFRKVSSISAALGDLETP